MKERTFVKKCVFIIPYFGKLPDFFPVFLKTCATNKHFDWFVFTDDKSKFDYPENVKRIDMTFEQLRTLAKSKFDFDIALKYPYKLCDYKPAYGYIFEEYIRDYPFWGHCDIDTLMGNLDKLLEDSLFNKYDKIFCLGHMIIYRNTYDNVRTFMRMARNRYFYKESFTKDRITAFDETWDENTSVNTVFLENGKRVFMEDWSVNFKILPTAFTRVRFHPDKYAFEVMDKKRDLYIWDNGNIYWLYMEYGKLIKKEELYMHFQQRKMTYEKGVLTSDCFLIVPNRFLLPAKSKIENQKDFLRESRYRVCFHYLEIKYGRLKKRLANGRNHANN